MDKRFIAHRPYIDNEANVSCLELSCALRYALPRRLDTLEKIDEIPVSLQEIGYDENCIPVGDLNFVREWLNKTPGAADPNMTPLEIPRCLREYARREYELLYLDEMTEEQKDASKFFIKDASVLKRWNSALYDWNVSHLLEDDILYVVSEKVMFLSEWRIFVLNGEVLAAQHYLGDPLIFPDKEDVYEMVRIFETQKPHPGAYTLDVGIFTRNDEHATALLEVHPFAACGLYGFCEPAELAEMLVKGYEWYRDIAPVASVERIPKDMR